MATFKIFRETALPTFPLAAHAVYLIAPTAKPDYVEMYVSNADGTAARRIINEADVQALINAAVAAQSQIQIVADITARNALAPTSTRYVYVKNATGDATVASGGATYLWDVGAAQWVKVSEAESLDVALTWANIAGKPNSSAIAIDSAVAASHAHGNKTQLDQIGQDANGDFTYNGALPKTAWGSTGW